MDVNSGESYVMEYTCGDITRSAQIEIMEY
jgi:hypothetical protein